MAQRRTKKRQALADLPAEEDPRAPLDSALFLSLAQPTLRLLNDDLLDRAKASAAVTAALRARHAAERAAERTADSFAEWQEHFVGQVGAAWLLAGVFVRTLEDRGLLDEDRIAGPGAADSQRLFFELGPSLSERDYLLTVFRELCHCPAARALFASRHSPVWLLGPGAEAAKALLRLFRAPRSAAPAFRFGQRSTRFLGDLYQDLDDGVRRRYALLQTPDFVEKLILDRTLEPAIDKFGLADTDLIDPTCGSGHFLLGAFERLCEHRRRVQRNDTSKEQAALWALDRVHGADLNPYAVAIARFRLTLAFLDQVGCQKLAQAPELPLHVAVADSLLCSPRNEQRSLSHRKGGAAASAGEERSAARGDDLAARAVLHRQYAAVVGNPPYITVKDAALRARYRALYPSACRSYSLAVPFCERFFELARKGGRVGLITAGSFMKREHGKKLIEQYLPTVNLDLIVNTIGAYIPGHGTPTVLLFGSHEAPVGRQVQVVLAKRGEPAPPAEPAKGLVWSALAAHCDDVGYEDGYISVAKVDRSSLAAHPLCLCGGGASQLKELLQRRAAGTLGSQVDAIGFGAVTRADDVFLLGDEATLERRRIPLAQRRRLLAGGDVRDWACAQAPDAIWPYDPESLEPVADPSIVRGLWPWRAQLAGRVAYGKTQLERGLSWFAYSMLFTERFRTPLTITFAFVATHNHFVLDRGGKIFNRSAPIIKLPRTATEDDHLALVAYLNSSTACFWLKQVLFDKGNRGEGGGTTAETWEKFYELDGTKLRSCPLPPWTAEQRGEASDYGRRLSELGRKRRELTVLAPIFDKAGKNDLPAALAVQLRAVGQLESEIRALQEQLDWLFYRVFGLTTHVPAPLPALAPGERASDIRFAREVCAGATGRRYFQLCRLPPPEEVILHTREQAAETLAAIAASKELRLLETPAYKRTFREGHRPPDPVAQARSWLLDRLEKQLSGGGIEAASRLQACLCQSPNEAAVFSFARSSAEGLMGAAAVPFAAALRHSESGLVKRAAWERTWELQRRQAAGEEVGDIFMPPRYAKKDFRSATCWRLRGKLDVPKERFISYPGCESDEDGEPIYGWAGWDHEQRARALGTLYWQRKTEESWDKERLTPLLAGLRELSFWLEKWHSEPRDDYGGEPPASYYDSFLASECRALGLTGADLRAWRPPAKPPRKPAARRRKR